MKTILVTGGAGFLGSNLCTRLLNEGNRVLCLDNFYTGRRQNIASLLKNSNFSLLEHDVTKPYDIPCDQIFNLACPASPPHYQKDPVYTTMTSVLGAVNALENARKHKARILQTSTSEVYGDPDIHPQPETYRGNVNPIGIRACYDEGKRCAESLFFDYARMYDVSVRVVRIFNTYGPLMDPADGRVVSNFIIQALQGKDITIYGDGSQTRSFCYVDDLVEAMMRFMANENDKGPINIGNDGEFTMLELAEKVLELTKTGSRLVYMPLPSDDPLQRRPDLAKARALLSWQPTVPLVEGLKRTIAYFRTQV